MKLLIVGGVAGGASAAARARRLSEEADIVLFERGPDVSFANCGLPYYLGGAITQRDKLLVATRERLTERYRLDVRTRTVVEAIDRQAKTVWVRDLVRGRTYEEPYDKLILAPGAAPIRPPLPGIDLPGVFTLRNLQDTDRIKAVLDRGVREAVIIGAGFIGLELVENLVRRGVRVTVVELQDQVLPPFDPEMTTPIADRLAANGVTLLLGEAAEAFEPAPESLAVRLRSGRRLPAQLVVLGVGVRPESKLAADAGLAVGPRGGILVNEHLQTSDPDVYAVGDAIEVKDFVTGEPAQVPLAGPANRQGRIAAEHIFGKDSRYRGTQGTAVVGVFDLTAALTGASEKTLRRLGRPFRKVYVHPTDHAGYYPGAQPLTLKLLFEPNGGKVLGAQAVGGAGVDKRIDVLALAIQAGLTVFDLEEAELAYAPQYGSAKDPINMAGFVAAGLLRGDHPQVNVEDLAGDDRPFLLDVRTPQEFAAGHIPGAVNVPVDELRGRLDDLPRDRPLAVYCQVGQRGYLATRLLLQAGFRAANVGGGFRTYQMFAGRKRPDARKRPPAGRFMRGPDCGYQTPPYQPTGPKPAETKLPKPTGPPQPPQNPLPKQTGLQQRTGAKQAPKPMPQPPQQQRPQPQPQPQCRQCHASCGDSRSSSVAAAGAASSVPFTTTAAGAAGPCSRSNSPAGSGTVRTRATTQPYAASFHIEPTLLSEGTVRLGEAPALASGQAADGSGSPCPAAGPFRETRQGGRLARATCCAPGCRSQGTATLACASKSMAPTGVPATPSGRARRRAAAHRRFTGAAV
jgi:NADPH-dependent 2,4-dienoyl-CoA reductase/sulfur reductase-like enzyme/rhodanese-related sulfurtransferase